MKDSNQWIITKNSSYDIIKELPFEIKTAATSSTNIPVIENVLISPNPTNDIIYIQTEENLQKVTIYNFSGEVVLQFTKHEIVNNSISLKQLNPGMYIIHIHTPQGISTHNVIKQ